MSTAFKNQLLIGDNLDRMRAMKSASVDMIYLDPPFNKQRVFSATGKNAPQTAFSDIWTLNDFSLARHIMMRGQNPALHAIIESMHAVNGNSWLAYLSYMAARLVEMRRILKSTGSIYYHCDPTMSHGIKLVMDAIFGAEHFQNEFVWYYGGGGASVKRWARKHDTILFYTKSSDWVFNMDAVRTPHKWNKGQKRADGSDRNPKGKIADDVFCCHAVMPWSQERVGYPTQKPLELLERIVLASSNRGDVVMDPFCGCATAMEAAENLGRKWIGIDISPDVKGVVRDRLKRAHYHAEHRARWNNRRGAGVSRIRLRKHCIKWQSPGGAGDRCYCNGCGLLYSAQYMTLDHIHPKGKGGVLDYDNSQLLCGACNQLKDVGDMGFLYVQLAGGMSKTTAGGRGGRQPMLDMINPKIAGLIRTIAQSTKRKKR